MRSGAVEPAGGQEGGEAGAVLVPLGAVEDIHEAVNACRMDEAL
eukprot:CAMPEP_0114607948 /NCGR_PEP_ID=MMETSP0168-20121206/2327_1 /TAXON_ID=95228 ORGANISM="Vannella sp., Strain DIVA3 517/6/12" /NCGR_SAMPLE_ID=MMETSP0168 /ASSEMBLY_ACC=CAM_ASM_000044 /LENGTH=43 /DNA_ID= /DNA_START= /DNA_END= /DNA_ORIENTATION=